MGQNETPPSAIQAAIDGRLGMFEDRLARLLYKLAVETDMGISAVLDCVQVDENYLRRQRADSVKNVRATNGLLTFEQKAKESESGVDGDGQWQGWLSRVPTSRAAAQYELGMMLLSDNPERHDAELRIQWLAYAARNGNDCAAYRLGKEYLKDKITERNTSKAVEYLTQSADAGNQYAQFFLDRRDSPKPPSVMLSVTRLLHHMSRIFQDGVANRHNLGRDVGTSNSVTSIHCCFHRLIFCPFL